MLEAFFFGYQAFTVRADEILARRGLSRVHHRILFFIAAYPELTVTTLLGHLGVSKQALNIPLRQLLEMHLGESLPDEQDRRKRLLRLSAEGLKLERALSQEQARLLDKAFAEAGTPAVEGWVAVNRALARAAREG